MGTREADVDRASGARSARPGRSPRRDQSGRRVPQRSASGARRMAHAHADRAGTRRLGDRARGRRQRHARQAWRSRRAVLGAGMRRLPGLRAGARGDLRSPRQNHVPKPAAFRRPAPARSRARPESLSWHRVLRGIRRRRRRSGRRRRPRRARSMRSPCSAARW